MPPPCDVVTLSLARLALVYLIASLIYIVLTCSYGRPFYDSLTEGQRKIKRDAVKKRGCAFAIGLVVGVIVVVLWRPLQA